MSSHVAVLIDFENLAYSVARAMGVEVRAANAVCDFSWMVRRVFARIDDVGAICVKRAYADWRGFGKACAPLADAGCSLQQLAVGGMQRKNHADIALTVDAMNLLYSHPHIDTFVIVSGDADFAPLVVKLQEHGKYTVGVGVSGTTSHLIKRLHHAFHELEIADGSGESGAKLPSSYGGTLDPSEADEHAVALLLDVLRSRAAEGVCAVLASDIMPLLKLKSPEFNLKATAFGRVGVLLDHVERTHQIKTWPHPQTKALTVALTEHAAEGKSVSANLSPAAGGKQLGRFDYTTRMEVLKYLHEHYQGQVRTEADVAQEVAEALVAQGFDLSKTKLRQFFTVMVHAGLLVRDYTDGKPVVDFSVVDAEQQNRVLIDETIRSQALPEEPSQRWLEGFSAYLYGDASHAEALGERIAQADRERADNEE